MSTILSLNAGSSSIKFALFRTTGECPGEPERIAGGQIAGIGVAPRLIASGKDGEVLHQRSWEEGAALSHEALFKELVAWLTGNAEFDAPAAVGHRVVHGGGRFVAPTLIDDAVLGALEALDPLAPLHQPHNLSAVRALRAALPESAHVACFDTAFHHEMPELATRFALPDALHEEGIRRYGFHGISYAFIARRLREIDPALAAGRVIAAHLGNGASLCAMKGGRSVDTTMGFTALDGLVMGTRSGALDPGVVLHLLRYRSMEPGEVETLLYEQSGLLGVSGISSDMQVLSESTAPEAERAIELFAWRAAREAGALMTSLGGLDGLVFTAGIGEHSALVRARICALLAWAGIEIDPGANEAHAPLISTAGSRIAVRIVPTDEERMIALGALAAIAGASESAGGGESA